MNKLAVAGAWLILATAAPAAQAYVYWANYGDGVNRTEGAAGATIGRANLDGAGVQSAFIGGANFPSGVAVDGGHLFWSNYGTGGPPNLGSVAIANLDGSGVNQHLADALCCASGIAVNATHVFWTDAANRIGRAELSGANPQPAFIPNSGTTSCGIAVDAGHIYWGYRGDNTQPGRIGRANLDGTGVEPNFIVGADAPCGVAVDGTYIYWANTGATTGSTIGRAKLDGTEVNQSFISGASGPCGVAVDAHRIYWANNGDSGTGTTIGRANLDGTEVNQSFISGASGPCGVAVDALGSQAPDLVTVPTLTGTPQPGQTLTCQPGSWQGTGIQFSYRFLRNGQPIDGSASATYAVTEADLGAEISCQELASNDAGQASGTSAVVVPAKGVPVNATPPTIAGLALAGEDLRCDPGSWDPPARRFTYEWFTVGDAVGTGQTYRVPGDAASGPGDFDPLPISCQVTAINDLGTGTPARSAQVQAVSTVPLNLLPPLALMTSTGPRPTDRQLTCLPGDFSQLPEPNYLFEWTRNGTTIPNEIDKIYTVTTDDLGRELACVVRAVNLKGISEPAVSAGVLVPLPVLGGATIRARRGFNRLDPSSFVAVSDKYLNLVGPRLVERFRQDLDAFNARCRARQAEDQALVADTPAGPPGEATPSRQGRVSIAFACELVRLAPDHIEVTEQGVIYKLEPLLPCGTGRGGTSCRKLPIGSSGFDPARPPSLPFDIAEQARAAEPKEILWDFNGDRRVDLVCPSAAPVARTLFDRDVYRVRATIIDASSAATGEYAGGDVLFDFFSTSGRAETRQTSSLISKLRSRFGYLGGGGMRVSNDDGAPAGRLRRNQPMACRTSVDPPSTAARPCATNGRIGNVALRGNLCPISARQIPERELAGLPADVITALEAASLAEGAAARAAAARGEPPVAGLPAFSTRQTQTAENYAGVAAALADSGTAPRNPALGGKARDLMNKAGNAQAAQFALDQIYVAKGPMSVNGVQVEPQNGTSTLIVPSDAGAALDDVRNGKKMLISAIDAVQRLGDLPLSPEDGDQMAVKLADDLGAGDQRLASFNILKNIDLGPLEAVGNTEAFVTEDGRVRVTTKASFPNVFAGPHGEKITVDLDLTGDADGRIRLEELQVDVPRANLLALSVEDLLLKYTSKGDRFEAGGKVRLTPIGPGIDIQKFVLKDKELHSLVLGLIAPPPGIPLYPGVFLSRFSGGFERGAGAGDQYSVSENALTLVASAGVAVGPSAGGCSVVGLGLSVRARFAPVLDLKANGQMELVCIPILKVDFTANGNGHVSLGAQVDASAGPLFIKGEVKGQLDLPRWQIGATLEGGVRDVPVLGTLKGDVRLVASNLGIAGCLGVSLPWPVGTVAAGAGMRFPSSGRLPSSLGELGASLRFFTGCDLRPFASFAQLVRATQGGVRSFPVPDGKGGLLLAVEGAGGAPRFVLKDPDGNVVVDATAPGEGGRSDRALWMHFPQEDRTIVSLRGAPGGKWTIDPAPGSPGIVDVKHSEPVAAAKIRASVGGVGSSRVLRYDVARTKGQVVRFVEEAVNGGRAIGTVKTGGRGTFRYVVAEAEGTRRRVVAQVTQDGLPRESRVVARYTAPNPTIPAPRVTLRRRGSRVTVRFRPSPRAAWYVVSVRAGDGTVATRTSRRGRAVTFSGIPRAAAVAVTVVPMSASGRKGRAGKARLGGKGRYTTAPPTFVRKKHKTSRT